MAEEDKPVYLKNIGSLLTLDPNEIKEGFDRECFNEYCKRKGAVVEIISEHVLAIPLPTGVTPMHIFKRCVKSIHDYIFIHNFFYDKIFIGREDLIFIANYIQRYDLELGFDINLPFYATIWVDTLIAIHRYYTCTSVSIPDFRVAELGYCLKECGVPIMEVFGNSDSIQSYLTGTEFTNLIGQELRCPLCDVFWAPYCHNRFNVDLFLDLYHGCRVNSFKCDNDHCFYIECKILNFRGDSRLLNPWVTNLRRHKIMPDDLHVPLAEVVHRNGKKTLRIGNAWIDQEGYNFPWEDLYIDSDPENNA